MRLTPSFTSGKEGGIVVRSFPPCKYHERCGLPGDYAYEDEQYCVLHFPDRNGKNIQVFERALSLQLKNCRYDLRSIYWPNGMHNPSFQGRRFETVADFRDTVYGGRLDFTECHFLEGVVLGGAIGGDYCLDRAQVCGAVQVESSTENRTALLLNGSHIRGPVDVRLSGAFALGATAARVEGPITIAASEVTLELSKADLQDGLTASAQYATVGNLHGLKWKGCLVLRDSTLRNGLRVEEVTPDAEAVLDLSSTLIPNGLLLHGSHALPRVRLDGAVIGGTFTAKAHVGLPRVALCATKTPPRFAQAMFENVDLSQCLLSGNPVGEMQLSNVVWATLRGRYVLYDEIAYRKGATTAISTVRENYQILKEKYRQMGDHVRSGDFHYGEMEMRRRERGWPWRILSLEGLYWALSGYGTGWFRAFAMLALIAVVFGAAYQALCPTSFASPGEALHFSLNTLLLQRPTPPTGFTNVGKWLQLIETIVGPLQAALLALAVRMRMRR
jgi:hypothetical protein